MMPDTFAPFEPPCNARSSTETSVQNPAVAELHAVRGELVEFGPIWIMVPPVAKAEAAAIAVALYPGYPAPCPMIFVPFGRTHPLEIVMVPVGSSTVDGVLIVLGLINGDLAQVLLAPELIPRASITPHERSKVFKALLTTAQKSSLVVQEPAVAQNAVASMNADEGAFAVPDVQTTLSPCCAAAGTATVRQHKTASTIARNILRLLSLFAVFMEFLLCPCRRFHFYGHNAIDCHSARIC